MEIGDENRFDLTGRITIRGRAPEFIGSYSVVYRGKWGDNTVAVKIIRSVGSLSTMRRKVRREKMVWETLEHPNILPFYGHADDEEFQPFGAFISPWCSNGDVGRFLEQYGAGMEANERVELWTGILSGVAFLHSRNPVIVHGDLKPGNILIDDNRNPRICDFGLSRVIQEGGSGGMTTTTEHTGTERYLAPELVTSNLPAPTTDSDVYAVGCLGLELIYLEKPYSHRQNNHHGWIITDIKEGVPPANRQDNVHSHQDVWWETLNSWQVLEALWNPDPARRPAAALVMATLVPGAANFDNLGSLVEMPAQGVDSLLGERDPIIEKNSHLEEGSLATKTRSRSDDLPHSAGISKQLDIHAIGGPSDPQRGHNTSSVRNSVKFRGNPLPGEPSSPSGSVLGKSLPPSPLHEGDEIGPGLLMLGEPISIFNTRTSHVRAMRVIRRLAGGSYAVVYLVREIVPSSGTFLGIHKAPPTPSLGRHFAVKCLLKESQKEFAEPGHLEARIHASVPLHENVVTLWSTLETASYLLLVLECVPGEDMFYFLEKSRDHQPDESAASSPRLPSLTPERLLSPQRLELIASAFSQMCEAIAHCHRNGIFHRDIKPENFMAMDSLVYNPITGNYDRSVSVKLTNFGLATRDAKSGDMGAGSTPYMSFECSNNITPTYATAPADIWSLGIVLINMLYHANPWVTTAAGKCKSFDYFLREPISFFMDRFPGMTPRVAEFFSHSVFCLLGDQSSDISSIKPPALPHCVNNTGRRITAERFGQWSRDLKLHLSPSARVEPTPVLEETTEIPSIWWSQLSENASTRGVFRGDVRANLPRQHKAPPVPALPAWYAAGALAAKGISLNRAM